MCVLFSQAVFASFDAKEPESHPIKRAGTVTGRGLLNILALPAELVTTGVREQRMHPYLWPVTYTPRFVYNALVRVTSGLNDVAFFPWIVAHTDDLSPFTEIAELPEYPWQV